MFDHPDLKLVAQKARTDLDTSLDRFSKCDQQNKYNMSYQNLVEYVSVYVDTILRLKKTSQILTTLQEVPNSQAPILALQSHLAQLLSVNIPDTSRQVSDTTVKLKFDMPGEGMVNMSMTIFTDVVTDMKDGYVDGKFVVGGIMSVSEFEQVTQIDLKAKLDIDILMTDSVYIKINAISVEGKSNDPDTQNNIDNIKKASILAQTMLGEKMIDILSGDNSTINQAMIIWQFQNQHNMLKKMSYELKNKPMITRYAQESDTYYGFFNTNICNLIWSASIANTDDTSSCKANLLEEITQNNAKTIFMNKKNDTYQMGITDRYTTWEKPTGAIKVYNNLPIITWTDKSLDEIKIPFASSDYNYQTNEDTIVTHGWLSYKNQKLDVNYRDENVSFTLMGPLTRNSVSLSGSLDMSGNLKWDDHIRGTINLEINNNSSANQTLTLLAWWWMGDKKILDLNLTSSQTTTSVTNLIKKQANNVISLKSLEKMFESFIQ